MDQATYAGELPIRVLPKSHSISACRGMAREIVDGDRARLWQFPREGAR